MNFYEGVVSGDLQQGDIFPNIPFFNDVDPFGVHILNKSSAKDAVKQPFSDNTTLKLCAVQKLGILISQTCDAQKRTKKGGLEEPPEYLTFAIVFPAEQYDAKYVANLGNYRKPSSSPNAFYLPAYADSHSPGIVSLQLLTTVNGSKLESYQEIPRLRLSRDALGLFQMRMAYFFGRYAASDTVNSLANQQA